MFKKIVFLSALFLFAEYSFASYIKLLSSKGLGGKIHYTSLQRHPDWFTTKSKFLTTTIPSWMILWTSLDNLDIGRGSRVDANVKIESQVKIGSHSIVGEKSHIGFQSTIGDNVTIGKNVIIRPYVTIANDVLIEDNTVVESHSKVANNAAVGANSFLGNNTKIGEHSQICSHCILENNVTVQDHVRLKNGNENKLAYAGDNTIFDTHTTLEHRQPKKFIMTDFVHPSTSRKDSHSVTRQFNTQLSCKQAASDKTLQSQILKDIIEI